MDHPGVTVRSIRLSKGIPQKQIYTGIVAKSFAISFEQGRSMLNLHDFIQVLERVGVSWNEFDFIQRGYRNSEHTSLWRQFAEAANNRNSRTLDRLYREHRDDRADFGRVVAYLARAFQHEQTADSEAPCAPCSEAEKRFLTRYLLDKESWSLEETNLFTSFYYLFEEEAQSELIRICYRSLLRYEEYPGYLERIYNLLTNYTSSCYEKGKRAEGDEWLQCIRELPHSKAYLHQMLNAKLCEALHHAAHGRVAEGSKLVEEVAGVYRTFAFRREEEDCRLHFEQIRIRYEVK
ncbi:hypothetical protein [Gorillibacterium sp. CAU 1737]|uniref:Rgg family transcriptional regulator n=1 Tax=Gorillibacterium sp. CAU 1737 TaxID=3140362 RepID=UPI00326075C9